MVKEYQEFDNEIIQIGFGDNVLTYLRDVKDYFGNLKNDLYDKMAFYNVVALNSNDLESGD